MFVIVLIFLCALPLMAQENPKLPEPVFEKKDSFTVVGIQLLDSRNGKEMMDLWTRFSEQVEKTPNRISGDLYGVSFYTKDYNPKTGEGFGYMAATEVKEVQDLPDGFVSRTIQAAEYAVFTYKGPISEIGMLYSYIYGEWMKTAKVQPINQEMFELYDEKYNPESEENAIQIWVPVKR